MATVPVKYMGQKIGEATVTEDGTVIVATIDPEYTKMFDPSSEHYSISVGYRIPTTETPKEK